MSDHPGNINPDILSGLQTSVEELIVGADREADEETRKKAENAFGRGTGVADVLIETFKKEKDIQARLAIIKEEHGNAMERSRFEAKQKEKENKLDEDALEKSHSRDIKKLVMRSIVIITCLITVLGVGTSLFGSSAEDKKNGSSTALTAMAALASLAAGFGLR